MFATREQKLKSYSDLNFKHHSTPLESMHVVPLVLLSLIKRVPMIVREWAMYWDP